MSASTYATLAAFAPTRRVHGRVAGPAVEGDRGEQRVDAPRVGRGRDGVRVAGGQADRAGALPGHDPVLDALGEIGRRDELQIDVQQRRAVEADEQPRLAARERLRVREQLLVVGTARPYPLPSGRSAR